MGIDLLFIVALVVSTVYNCGIFYWEYQLLSEETYRSHFVNQSCPFILSP